MEYFSNNDLSNHYCNSAVYVEGFTLQNASQTYTVDKTKFYMIQITSYSTHDESITLNGVIIHLQYFTYVNQRSICYVPLKAGTTIKFNGVAGDRVDIRYLE